MARRRAALAVLTPPGTTAPRREYYDLAVVGGGINGCGVARDAAGRGLSVLLAEQADLASGTSSASSKLIHGGLRYLEHGAFRLVRESLKERRRLLDIAPHLIRPMRFVLPHVAAMRPAWLIRCGLFLYDRLAGDDALPPTKKVDLTRAAAGAPLRGMRRTLGVGFEYSDCWADDSRLVVLNARDAADRGADILPRTRCVGATPKKREWEVTLQNNGGRFSARARCLINATGPWAARFLGEIRQPRSVPLRLVQGSHLVVPKLYEGEHAYVLQNPDGRTVFAIPYERDWTLIGTTDRNFDGDPAHTAISDEEEEYLQNTLRRFFGATTTATHRFSGVRPLVADKRVSAQKANRDYTLRLQRADGAPLFNIYGGKLTTYRKLAETLMQRLCGKGRLFVGGGDWSAAVPLPGGDLPDSGVAGVANTLVAADRRISTAHANRLARAYGGVAPSLLPDDDDGWQHIDADLYAWEADYLMRREWAQTADDMLWRRSNLGLTFSADGRRRLTAYIKKQTTCLN